MPHFGHQVIVLMWGEERLMGRAESKGADSSAENGRAFADEKSALLLGVLPEWPWHSQLELWLFSHLHFALSCPLWSIPWGRDTSASHSVPTCGLQALQGLHPWCTCMEPSQLQTSSLCQFLKANFSCAESRGKISIDRKQAGAQPGLEWYELNNQSPIPKILSGSAAEGDEFPCLACAFHSSCVQLLWTPLETVWFSLMIQFGRLWRF